MVLLGPDMGKSNGIRTLLRRILSLIFKWSPRGSSFYREYLNIREQGF